MLSPGLYEQVVNKALGKELDAIAEQLCQTASIDEAEAYRVLAKYVAVI